MGKRGQEANAFPEEKEKSFLSWEGGGAEKTKVDASGSTASSDNAGEATDGVLGAAAGKTAGKANAGGCRPKGDNNDARPSAYWATVEAEERSEALAAEDSNNEDTARG
jgi:hypothetical protein